MKPYIYQNKPKIVILCGELQFDKTQKLPEVFKDLKGCAEAIGANVYIKKPNPNSCITIIVEPPHNENIWYEVNADPNTSMVTSVETFSRIDSLIFDSDSSVKQHTITT